VRRWDPGGANLAGRRPTEAHIDLDALRWNYAQVCRAAQGRGVIAVVKADAYGHGAGAISRALVEAGCPRVATVTVDEGVALRDAGVAVPILVMGGVHDAEEAVQALARDLTLALHDREQLAWVAHAARGSAAGPARVHVEVDTGMRRMGVALDSAPALLEKIAGEPAVALEGVYTHLGRADERDLSPSVEQLELFESLLVAVRARGIDPGLIHFANSVVLMVGAPLLDVVPDAGAVRPGLMLYGVNPSPDLRCDLRPVMTLRTRVVAVRSLLKGEGVGYSAAFRATRDTRLATLPIGYGDGVPVSASNRATVLIRGRRFPVVGRVSMDYVTVDVSSEPIAPGEEAILFGAGQGTSLPVEEAAELAGTIAYELLVRVGARVPRVVVG